MSLQHQTSIVMVPVGLWDAQRVWRKRRLGTVREQELQLLVLPWQQQYKFFLLLLPVVLGEEEEGLQCPMDHHKLRSFYSDYKEHHSNQFWLLHYLFSTVVSVCVCTCVCVCVCGVRSTCVVCLSLLLSWLSRISLCMNYDMNFVSCRLRFILFCIHNRYCLCVHV